VGEINTRKLRIASTTLYGENFAMNEKFCEELFEKAVELSYQSFEEPTDLHVEWVFGRLVFNWKTGAGVDGATTLH
tara:strand:+ start:6183 stop:6410 length:228 start_codon:yes stop_codon:yes gene_type:complete